MCADFQVSSKLMLIMLLLLVVMCRATVPNLTGHMIDIYWSGSARWVPAMVLEHCYSGTTSATTAGMSEQQEVFEEVQSLYPLPLLSSMFFLQSSLTVIWLASTAGLEKAGCRTQSHLCLTFASLDIHSATTTDGPIFRIMHYRINPHTALPHPYFWHDHHCTHKQAETSTGAAGSKSTIEIEDCVTTVRFGSTSLDRVARLQLCNAGVARSSCDAGTTSWRVSYVPRCVL
jgi:hypothetical protein